MALLGGEEAGAGQGASRWRPRRGEGLSGGGHLQGPRLSHRRTVLPEVPRRNRVGAAPGDTGTGQGPMKRPQGRGPGWSILSRQPRLGDWGVGVGGVGEVGERNRSGLSLDEGHEESLAHPNSLKPPAPPKNHGPIPEGMSFPSPGPLPRLCPLPRCLSPWVSLATLNPSGGLCSTPMPGILDVTLLSHHSNTLVILTRR